MDTVKARLQAVGGTQYRGILHCIRSTLATEGLMGLYRGFGVVAGLATPAACMYLTSYEWLKPRLGATDGCDWALLRHLACGVGAEAVACLLFVPADVVKERLQVQRSGAGQTNVLGAAVAPPSYSGSFNAIRTICKTEGLLGLYKGYAATLISFGPFSALYFAFYEELRKFVALATHASDKSQLAPAGTLAASSIAGASAAVITSPLDMAKLRLQTQRVLKPGELAPTGYINGMRDHLAAIHREGGIRALFRGAGARVAFHTPSTCITFTCFEECRRLARRFI